MKQTEQPVLLSRSQRKTAQDLWVDRILNGKREGYFVDLGAYDGLKGSNTAALERDRGWNGLLVEAIPEMIPVLEKNRPNIARCCAFCWDREDEVVDFVVADGLSGVVQFLPPNVKRRYREKLQANPSRKFTTTTLQRVLDQHQVPGHVDYLSVDANGTDLKVLQGLDFGTRRFSAITVEHNFQTKRLRQIIQLLGQHGYSHEGNRAFDAFFVDEELSGCGVEI